MAELSPAAQCCGSAPFVFQQELALSGDAKHSSSHKGHFHPRSGLLWRPELERLQHLLKCYFSTKESPSSEFVFVSCCIFIVFAKFWSSRSSFTGSLCVFCAINCSFVPSPLSLNALSSFKPPIVYFMPKPSVM